MGTAGRLFDFIKTFTGFFHTRSDSNAEEIRAYLSGLMQGKRRAKNMERMEEDVPGFDYQRVHNTISHSPWDPRPLMDEIARRANGLLGGGPRVRLVGDETSFEKKGSHSVGVARQYLGRLGKVDNGQVAVCLSLASGQQSSLVDIRLYVPEAWCQDPARCQKAGIPEEERRFRTKTELLLEAVRHQRALGIDFDVVSVDSGFGGVPWLLHALDRDGETFVAETHCTQRIWEEAPWPHDEGIRLGRRRKRPQASGPSERVDAWAAAQPEAEWRRLKVRDSDQGWVEVNYLAQRVWVMEGDQGNLWWLLVWENPDETRHDKSKKARRHYALSNAGAEEDPRVLVGDGVQRNVVERDFRDGKSETGMADYQTRGWLAWHHHMALVMMAMLFLVQEKMHHPRPATEEGPIHLTAGDITFVLERLLPQRGRGAANEAEVRRQLEERLAKRARDQTRRRAKTRKSRPPLWPDEVIPK